MLSSIARTAMDFVLDNVDIDTSYFHLHHALNGIFLNMRAPRTIFFSQARISVHLKGSKNGVFMIDLLVKIFGVFSKAEIL